MDYIGMGQRIKQTRKERKILQSQLATRCGRSASFIGHVERGSRKPSIETLVTLSLALDISLDYLILGDASFDRPSEQQQQLFFQHLTEMLKIHILAFFDQVPLDE